MAQLKRTGASATIPGVGYVHSGVIHTVPDALVDDLLATGEWEALHAAPVERWIPSVDWNAASAQLGRRGACLRGDAAAVSTVL